MLNKKQIQKAIRYNSKRMSNGTLNINDLPWPLFEVTGSEFALATALYQHEGGLTVDGQLGPMTEKKIRARYRKEDDTKVETPKKRKKSMSSDGYSNAIVVNGARIMLPDELVTAGLTASNYLDDGEPHFRHRKRTKELIHFVVHETVGNTAKGCKDTLIRKGYGVQLILDPSGHLSCHGDLVCDRMVHANQVSNTSFGLEIVNPYNPIYVVDEKIWSNDIPRQWWTWVPSLKIKGIVNKGIAKMLKRKGWGSVPKRYVTPTSQQMFAIKMLAPWLCKIAGVQYRFPTKGLNKRKRKIDGLTLKPKAKPGPGVVAHGDFSSHADARYVLEMLIKEKNSE